MNPQPTPLQTFVQNVQRIASFTVVALSFAAAASGATVGLHVLTAANNGGTNGNALATTDSAGADIYAQTNWNNFVGPQGTNVVAVDSTGAPAITVSWTAPNTWSQSGNTTVNQGTPDGNLMNPYLDNNGSANVTFQTNIFSTVSNNNRNWPLVYLTGIQAWLAGQGATAYDLVVYSDGDGSPAGNNSGRTGEYWPVAASGQPTNIALGADLATHVFVADRNNFINNQIYSLVPPFIQSGVVAEFGNFPGNYVVISSLTNDTVLLRSQRFNSRAPINAVQVIPRTNTVPAVVAPIYDAPVYAGGTARFAATAAGALPLTYQWQKNGVNLSDSGNTSGSLTSTLTITGAGSGDVASYSVVVTNPFGVVTSAPAALTLVSTVPNSYPERIATNSPYAYWRFNDSNDPTTNYAPAYDFFGGFTGTYGNQAQNGPFGSLGPQPPEFPGFESTNTALLCSSNTIRTWVTCPPLTLNTNTVTFCAWIYPTKAQSGSTAILFSRLGSDAAGLGYGNNNNLGYTWNSNNSATYSFGPGSPGYPATGLQPQSNTWSFVALAVSPTNAVLYLYNTNGQFSATNSIVHSNEFFSGLTFIGCDAPNSPNLPQGRSFNGYIDEVAVFKRTLADTELYTMFKKGLGVGIIPAVVSVQPVPLVLYTGRTATFSVIASGDKPLTYQWQTNGVNLVNGGRISGANSSILTISNVTFADAAMYSVVVDNVAHSPASSTPVALTVVAPPSPLSPYEAALQTVNPVDYWRFNEGTGSVYAIDYWGGNIATNENVTASVAGPQPPTFPGFETNNAAYSYDGVTSATDTELVGLNNGLSSFSIIGWFNPTANQPPRTGLFGQNDVTEFGFHAVDASGLAQYGIWTPNGGAAYLPQGLITPGQWYFGAAVGNGASLNLYLFTTNGSGGSVVSQATTVAATTNYGVSSFPFRIGGGGVLDPTGNYFSGLIDEVAVFHRALSVGELSTLFAAGIGVTALPPQITAEPTSLILYAGRTATFSVTAVGSSPLSYQWRTNGVPTADGGNVAGSSAATLAITSVSNLNAASYDVVITNTAGAVTSSVVTLQVITPPPGGFEATVLSMNPLAYYRLNETNDPSTGIAVDNDYWGGHPGVYGTNAQNGFNGILGPQPPNFTFDTQNFALSVNSNLTSCYATAPFGSLSTNTVTMCMWIMPTGTFDNFAGLLFNRNSGVAGGFGYTGGHIGYTWNNNNAATYNAAWSPGPLLPPLNEWSFVALVVSPTNAIVYMYNTQGEVSATNTLAHTSDVFGNNWQIGRDNIDNNNDGARTFTGIIDEVAVFTKSLTAAQLRQLYVSGSVGLPDSLTIRQSGGNVILTWPYGMLLQAPAPTGPWSPVPGNPASPYTVPPLGTMQFYRVQVQ